MPLDLDRSGEVTALHAGDRVRLRTERLDGCVSSVQIDLSDRAPDKHCLVALPAMPNVARAGGPLRVWFTARYSEDRGPRRPFTLFVAAYRRRTWVGEARLRFFADAVETPIMLEAPIADEADSVQIVVYADLTYRGSLELRDLRMTVGSAEYRIGAGGEPTREVGLERSWDQRGTRVVCSSAYGEHWAEMPDGWRLDALDPTILHAVDWLLFAAPDRRAFEVHQAPPSSTGPWRPGAGSTLLHYTATPESTAALALLPQQGFRYFCQRAVVNPTLSTGAIADLPDPAPWSRRAARVPNVTIVPTTFELIQAAAGGPVGFGNAYGPLAVGLLLAPYLGTGTVAVGSILEHVFLGSGHLFVDVVALDRSSYRTVRSVVEGAGLRLALPTSGCSEVLTSRISARSPYADLAISCQRPDPDGGSCRTCFACFRRLRFEGDPGSVVDPGVVPILERRPLKSAVSVVYAAQRSAFRHPSVDEYADVDVGFLDRYFDYAIDHMLPEDLAGHARARLRGLGFEPMSEDDELRLRTIGQMFAPEEFDWKRAGMLEVGRSA